MDSLFSAIFSADFISSVLRLSTPILFAGLAALITDKAGVINIGLEGIMLSAALAGVVGSAFGGNAFVGLLLALVVGVAIGLLMAYFAIGLKTDIVLTGIALNLMASGGTVFLLYVITKDKGMSTSLKSFTMPVIQLPLIKSIPVLGDILSGHNLLTYLAFLFTVLVWILLYWTPLGLRIRVVGENISAAESVGIPVKKVQFTALAISGVLASMGGAYMSMGYMDKFARDMTAGRGFIALAAEALGRATPLGTLIASLFFGMVDALSSNLQILNVPVQFVQMLPYVCTIVGLVIYSAIKGKNKTN
ncbi:ABC transporter permease [Oribacterium parvum]|uniref:ABC transporter permease n=2 Tax=Oribacterium parvum TaxID=1501329 RepID=UPI0028E72732|nr:ABC transporter permease [Oribacterium parvum]